MSRTRLFIYFFLPLALSLLCVGFYFSGIPTLQWIIAPDIAGVHPNSKREFGLLENLQNLTILLVILFSVRGLFLKHSRIEQAALVLLALMSTLVFLEEIDYGLHFWEYARGIPPDLAQEVRNFHNVGDRTSQIKRFVDLVMVLFFVLFPLLGRRSTKPFIQYLRPSPYIILTLIVGAITRGIAHTLSDQGRAEGGMLDHNISEFREFVTYYVIMLYVYEFASKTWVSTHKKTPTA